MRVHTGRSSGDGRPAAGGPPGCWLAGIGCPVGEPGSGKEHFARHLHHLVDAAAPFVRIDCGDASDARIESALSELPTLRSDGGTVFLDALPMLPLAWQQRLASLLPAVRSGQGGDGRFRVVASLATNLGVAARSGAIDAALLTRLELVEISIPALRQRRADIPALVEYFLDVYASRHNIARCDLDRAALVLLWQHDWPGNVRELESALERLAIVGRGRVVGVAELSGLMFPDRWPSSRTGASSPGYALRLAQG